MTYDRTTNQYELSTGRRFYANAGIIGISPNHDHDAPIPHGYDGSVVIDGSLLEPFPELKASREYCAQSLKSIQPGHIVEYSPELMKLAARGRRG